jgi:hypothetical protein
MIQFGPYLIAMRDLPTQTTCPCSAATALCGYWAENDFLDLRAREAEKRRQLAAKLYDCIGHAMADFVTRGTPTEKAAASPGSDR